METKRSPRTSGAPIGTATSSRRVHGGLTDRRLRRGKFTSIPALMEAIDTWVSHRNADPTPSCGTPQPTRSSKKYAEAVEPSHKSNPRRGTSVRSRRNVTELRW